MDIETESVLFRYQLDNLIDLIKKHEYKIVVLQFPDEELEFSVPVYDYLSLKLPSTSDIFITADSTWGSSIDDVSAMHCDGDVLIYFGTDLSSSGTIPVVILPPRKPIDETHCQNSLQSAIENYQKENTLNKLVLFYEPGFYFPSQRLVETMLSQQVNYSIELAELPNHADLLNWIPRLGRNQAEELDKITMGGLLVSANILEDKNNLIVYIGEKTEQIVNILLRACEHTILHYIPTNTLTTTATAVKVLKGTETLQFRERYGGVLRVKDAHIVGIIIGSMGLTSDLTKDLLHRLQVLIRSAHKKYYCFVMGRLNEAKLCNFPEVDVFCLVSNEDNANIKPKTFHKPVVTPFELELGLGAREWGSTFSTDLDALVGNGEEDLRAAVERVKEENPDYGDSSDEEEGPDRDYVFSANRAADGEGDTGSSNTAAPAAGCGKQSEQRGCGCTTASNTTAVAPSSAVVPHGVLGGDSGSKGQLTVFHSAAAEYLQRREYKGLIRNVGEDAEMEIKQGQFGVAAGYSVNSSSKLDEVNETSNLDKNN